MRIVEEDAWRYEMVRNDGAVVEGLSMVCCVFVFPNPELSFGTNHPHRVIY